MSDLDAVTKRLNELETLDILLIKYQQGSKALRHNEKANARKRRALKRLRLRFEVLNKGE